MSLSYQKNIPEELKRKIYNLEYLNCQKNNHEGQQLNSICLNNECSHHRLICCYCEEYQHKSHTIIPLKDYLLYIQNQRYSAINSASGTATNNLTNSSNLPNQSSIKHNKNYINYLSYIKIIEEHKVNLLTQISLLKQKFLNQIDTLQVVIQKNSRLYVEKISKIIHLYFGNKNHVFEDIQKNITLNNKFNIENIFQELVQNFQIPEDSQEDAELNVMTQQKKQNKKPLIEKFQEIKKSFHKKCSNFVKGLEKFDLQFIPKLSSTLEFQNITFNNYFSNYEWHSTLKGKKFQINPDNKNVIRVISSSNTDERFALMKTQIPNHAKNKFTWALRINKLVGWIGVGIALKNVITNAQLKFNHTQIGHGSYLISGNGYSWSHSYVQMNSKNQAFSFVTGDIIIMQYDPVEKTLTFKKSFYPFLNFKLNVISISNDQRICPCVNMCSINDQVEIIPVPQSIVF